MTPDPILASDTLKRLMKEAGDSRRQRSLQSINQACASLYANKSLDFTYRRVVAVGKELSLTIPSEKTIVNRTGDHYRQLIAAWRSQAESYRVTTAGPQETWIDKINDPVLRMSVILLAKELKAMKSKEARKGKSIGAPVYIGNDLWQQTDSFSLNAAEWSALKASIEHDSLRRVGLSVGSRGEIYDSTGRTILKPGFHDAIVKILAHLPSSGV
ncbi:gamma-mobile-trio protein GmtX [Pseudomonas syringae]|uniref:gamma-mobile-trio protein GmtX n=1 Tax=Pseudomonas syringae TaxID=317 RepID=UPI000E32123A|nr:gamma-mobile-trio protein GmtX [Pseudomonas syringae]